MNFFDLHCDTLGECFERNESLAQNSLCVSLAAKPSFKKWAQVFAIWIPEKLHGGEAWEYYRRAVLFFEGELEKNGDKMVQIRCGADLDLAFEQGKCAAILAVENASALGGEIGRLEQMTRDGVKIITLTWNGENEFAHGVNIPEAKRIFASASPKDYPRGGLKPLGRELLKEMKAQNIAVDLSHLNAKSFWQTVELGDVPPMLASHSNCRTVYEHPRALSDAQIKILIERGALIGLSFAYLRKRKGRLDFAAIRKNLENTLKLGAQELVSIGTDYDGYIAPKGLENISKMPNLRKYLAKRGYTEYILNRLFFTNAYAWFKRNFQ